MSRIETMIRRAEEQRNTSFFRKKIRVQAKENYAKKEIY